jgi:hypothetical protein
MRLDDPERSAPRAPGDAALHGQQHVVLGLAQREAAVAPDPGQLGAADVGCVAVRAPVRAAERRRGNEPEPVGLAPRVHHLEAHGAVAAVGARPGPIPDRDAAYGAEPEALTERQGSERHRAPSTARRGRLPKKWPSTAAMPSV